MSVIGVKLVVLKQHLVFWADHSLQDCCKFTECGVVLYQICGGLWFCVSYRLLRHKKEISGIILVDMGQASKLIKYMYRGHLCVTFCAGLLFVHGKIQCWLDFCLTVHHQLGKVIQMSEPGSVVGIETAYGLDGPGIESWWGEIFRTCPDRP